MWKEGVVVPVVKKKERKVVEHYREVTLMLTLYKVYALALTKRLRKELNGKQVIPHYQTNFRRRVGTMNNVYVLNYMMGKQLERRKQKLVVLFVNLKAAFDMMDRKVLEEPMRKKRVKERLVCRVEKMFRETKSRVNVREKMGEWLWTAREVKQG